MSFLAEECVFLKVLPVPGGTHARGVCALVWVKAG